MRDHGLWAASAPTAPATSALAADLTADAVIVGGGYTGCSTALHLAELGRSAIILEAGEIGFGGSGRNVGLVNAGLWTMPGDLLAAAGALHGERLLEQLGRAPKLVFDIVARHGIACEAEHRGTLHCAVGRSGLREIGERHRQWSERGADVELLDADAASKLIGSKAYSGALLDRRAGTIQPLAYARGLAAAAIRSGAEIFTRSAATGLYEKGPSWTVATSGGSVTAPWVIVATDAYSSGIWTAIRREQVMLPYFNLATRPLPPDVLKTILPGRRGAWNTSRILSSFRLDAAGRLVFGSVGALRGPGRSIHAHWGERELARLFPQLGTIEFEHAWYGQIGMTDDALPRLHSPAPNIVSISGFNGRGIAPGTSFGRDLARLVAGEIGADELPLPMTAAREAPYHALRGAFYEAGAALAHLAGSRI
ncbi:NAD(P)/FAD-dependent oxidoreductase [Sphingopyxis panaciterrae]